ncbi:uncharacterized protein [Arachis hypogaea]|uniref:uncharacterized protein n=1 Tax=Arachis hypogaea TaxID=3818 RepID=UPI003B212DFF
MTATTSSKKTMVMATASSRQRLLDEDDDYSDKGCVQRRRCRLGRNIEVYVDDMVAKTKVENSHIADLAKIFGQIRAYNMRLNPEKCTFDVPGGKFLWFILTSRGIECLRKNMNFQWDENCEAAFTSLIQFLSETPILQKPKLGEPLYLYLPITDSAISPVLVAENDKVQQPVYFSHIINIRIRQPLRQILAKPELAGSLIKWSIKLSEFDIHYQPRGSIKSQYLADFVAEFTAPNSDAGNPEWILFVDGASNPKGLGEGILLENQEGIVLEHSLRFSFKASNNQVEYEALIARLRLAIDLHIFSLKVYCDSLLVVQQDCRQKVKTCDNCQKHAWIINIPAENLHHSMVQPLAKITSSQMISFVWKNIICKFEHPQSNGLAEAANKVLLQAKGLWAELILEILWGYNTTMHSTTKETPFHLVYGSEAMIPTEISQDSLRTQADHHDQARRAELDLIEEVRNTASVRHRAIQQQIG